MHIPQPLNLIDLLIFGIHVFMNRELERSEYPMIELHVNSKKYWSHENIMQIWFLSLIPSPHCVLMFNHLSLSFLLYLLPSYPCSSIVLFSARECFPKYTWYFISIHHFSLSALNCRNLVMYLNFFNQSAVSVCEIFSVPACMPYG